MMTSNKLYPERKDWIAIVGIFALVAIFGSISYRNMKIDSSDNQLISALKEAGAKQ